MGGIRAIAQIMRAPSAADPGAERRHPAGLREGRGGARGGRARGAAEDPGAARRSGRPAAVALRHRLRRLARAPRRRAAGRPAPAAPAGSPRAPPRWWRSAPPRAGRGRSRPFSGTCRPTSRCPCSSCSTWAPASWTASSAGSTGASRCRWAWPAHGSAPGRASGSPRTTRTCCWSPSMRSRSTARRSWARTGPRCDLLLESVAAVGRRGRGRGRAHRHGARRCRRGRGRSAGRRLGDRPGRGELRGLRDAAGRGRGRRRRVLPLVEHRRALGRLRALECPHERAPSNRSRACPPRDGDRAQARPARLARGCAAARGSRDGRRRLPASAQADRRPRRCSLG